jgi:hypothetical protein
MVESLKHRESIGAPLRRFAGANSRPRRPISGRQRKSDFLRSPHTDGPSTDQDGEQYYII